MSVAAQPSMARDIQPAAMVVSRVGESPMWHPIEQVLYWCDIPAREIRRLDPRDGRVDHWRFDSEPACCAPALGGGLRVAFRDGIWHFDPASGRRQRRAAAPYDETVERFNDGKCDPQGRFWAGTIYEPRDRPAAALYRHGRDGLVRVAGGVTNSNGLAWSPDGATLYWADTREHCIRAYDFDAADGSLSGGRDFARFALRQPTEPLERYGGRPDGAAVDSQGRYWVAMYEGARLLCLSPDGAVVEEVQLPVRCPTMPAFGGADLRTLYVTTAREGRPAGELADQPWAGCVLQMRVEVPGLPAHLAAD